YKIPGGYPCSWTFPAGKGYVGYFMEAHNLTTMADFTPTVWDKFWTQFMYYIAGYSAVTVVTNPGARLDFPLDRDGITFHPGGAAGVLAGRAPTWSRSSTRAGGW